jgi:hypothetical protein
LTFEASATRAMIYSHIFDVIGGLVRRIERKGRGHRAHGSAVELHPGIV